MQHLVVNQVAGRAIAIVLFTLYQSVLTEKGVSRDSETNHMGTHVPESELDFSLSYEVRVGPEYNGLRIEMWVYYSRSRAHISSPYRQTPRCLRHLHIQHSYCGE
jgi:hypothetical protein